MNYYKSRYYSYQPSPQSTNYYSYITNQDHQTQQRGYGQRTGDHRRQQQPSLTSGYSHSSFDSPSSYLSSPKDLFGYESQNFSAKTGTGAGASASATASQQQQSGESISGMLSNFSKALGKAVLKILRANLIT